MALKKWLLERRVKKAGLKLNIQKTKSMASGPITSWEIDGETVEAVSDFNFLGSKIAADDDCSHEIKRHLLLGRKAMTNRDCILESKEELMILLTKVKKESEKVDFKLSIHKTKIMASGPIISWQIDGETMEIVTDCFGGLQNHCRWWLQPWN